MRANDVSLKGAVVMDMGECTWDRRQSRGGKNPVTIEPSQLTHRLFKFLDMKEAKRLGIPQDLASFAVNKEYVGKFLEKRDKDD
jgi:hypothetical protein